MTAVTGPVPEPKSQGTEGNGATVKTRELGRTGIQVSPYCLGTMMFGQVGNPDPDDCVRIIHRALDSGINFVDTADVYGPHGMSEEIVGKALKGRRDDIVLATKVNGAMGEDPNRGGSSRRWITAEVEHSLRRLRTDHIDLYQMHHPDPRTDIEETLSALTDLVRSGKVRAIGASNLPASEIVEAQWVAERRGLQRFRTEQPTYSLLNRGIEREILPVCQRYGMGTLVWSPLAMGLLTGRYRKGGPPVRNARMNWVPRHLTDERKLDAVERLIPLAEEAGLSLTHLAMAFAITHPAVTSAIIGPRTMEQLEDLLAGAAVTLDDDVLDRIDQIVAPGTDIGPLDVSYTPPAVERAALRRRSADERAAVTR
ncbi:aldo/keto reductase [Streptomyces mordarskii]|uniref:Aldo/keto reductase n=1 Tax=Streptomyces mordarskii TaxID=1226758 RepID=A0ABP3N1R0_9ACTN